MRTPVKEGHRSPVRSPAAHQSPSHKSKPSTEQPSPGKVQRSRSPPKEEKHVTLPQQNRQVDQEYDDDFEEATHDNLSSLEEEQKGGK